MGETRLMVSPVLAKGYCKAHYSIAQQRGLVGKPCEESGCMRSVASHGKCGPHFYKAVRAGQYGIKCVVGGCDGYSTGISKPGPCESCYHRIKRYGVTVETLSRLLNGTACELCKVVAANHVDHCHKTGTFRGLLCGPCNMSLGKFNDDPAKLRAAADYIERNVTRDAA